MKTIKLLVLLVIFNTSSIIAQQYQIDDKTISALKKAGIDFSQNEKEFFYIKTESENTESIDCSINLQLLISKEGEFIDDEMPEGGFDFESLEERTDSIWNCVSEGLLKYKKGLFIYLPNNLCETISENLIPGGDMFIPGGDMFIPGGDTFIPGGDTFSEDDRIYFLKISFSNNEEIAPAILLLKVK